jgi:predicted metal-dependent HD superfamily phosphohydrolase
LYSHLESAWSLIADTFDIDEELSREWLQQVIHRYSEPHRFYHTLDHIDEMCHTLNLFRRYMEDDKFSELLIAAIFHDFIYEAGSKSNETLSAAAARTFCGVFHGDGPNADDVAGMIMETVHHDPDPRNFRACALVDADLLRFASERSSYHDYCIRQEFIAVDTFLYLSGRITFLTEFQKRKPFFYTDELEINTAAALANIQSQLDGLLALRFYSDPANR